MTIQETDLLFETISPTCAFSRTDTMPPIHVYRLNDFSRATIDVWIQSMLGHLAVWDAYREQPWLALHDLRAVKGLSSITPYAGHRFQGVAAQYAQLFGRVCFVVKLPPFLERMGRSITYNFVNRNQPHITPHITDEFTAGIEWLLAASS